MVLLLGSVCFRSTMQKTEILCCICSCSLPSHWSGYFVVLSGRACAEEKLPLMVVLGLCERHYKRQVRDRSWNSFPRRRMLSITYVIAPGASTAIQQRTTCRSVEPLPPPPQSPGPRTVPPPLSHVLPVFVWLSTTSVMFNSFERILD